MARRQLNGHRRNRLLASMPERDYARFEPELRSTTFKQGAIVQEAGEFIDRVYFVVREQRLGR